MFAQLDLYFKDPEELRLVYLALEVCISKRHLIKDGMYTFA